MISSHRVAAWMRMSCWGGALIVVLGVLIGRPASGGEGPRQDVLKIIAEVYEAREQQRNPVWVKFDVTRFETAAWQRANGRRGGADVDWKVEGEYARKGKKTRTW